MQHDALMLRDGLKSDQLLLLSFEIFFTGVKM